MNAPTLDDPYRQRAQRVCDLVTVATGLTWPEHLVATMTLALNAITDLERLRPSSKRYTPADRLRWLRGDTTHDHRRPVLQQLVDVYSAPVETSRQVCRIALGTARFDEPDSPGSSSALQQHLINQPVVTDRVAQRWAACLVRADAGRPVAVAVTNRLRREVARHRRLAAADGDLPPRDMAIG